MHSLHYLLSTTSSLSYSRTISSSSNSRRVCLASVLALQLQACPHVAQQPPPCRLHLLALPLLLCCCPVGLALQVQLHHCLLKLLQQQQTLK
jgi:hypothetical protein